MTQQLNLFEGLIPRYKIEKPIRLIEMFAGIGSQYQALKNLGVNVEHHRIVEWQVNSIQTYNDIHIQDYTDYSKDISDQEVFDKLSTLGVSMDYNKPMTVEQIKRKGSEWARKVYNNVVATKNLVNISTTKGEDLAITDTDKYDYVLTYSFPCQDLSLAGKSKGMARGSGTRSGLLWEVERILKETKQLPKILLMENVPEVIGSNFIKDFQEWEAFLTSLGYSSHTEILNAKHYGIPQNRQRAFMVSILGEYLYDFPQKMPLNLRLRDMLEEKVDEKYYISEKLFNYFNGESNGWKRQYRPLDRNSENSHTITTREGNVAEASYIDESISIPEDTVLGYALAKEGDGVYINRPEQKRGVVQNQMIQTIKTSSNDIGVVVAGQFQAKDRYYNANGTKREEQFETRKDELANCVLTHDMKNMVAEAKIPTTQNLRIRKLTPRECYRLMGFSDKAFDLAQANQSNSTLYHQAGDSIVVNVLMAIFKELF
jgi:DNA (cytosine-5)-methyltransferase 1